MRSPAVELFCRSPETVRALQTENSGDTEIAILPPERIARFIGENPEMAKLIALQSRMNVFEALGVGDKEVRHSRLLAWLLDPRGSHGCGEAYLERFLRAVTVEGGEPWENGRIDLGAVHVECEDDHIDILLVSEPSRFVCAIENKVHSGQRPGQLITYRQQLEKRFAGYTRKLVFLTLREEAPGDAGWVVCRYGKVLQAVLGPESEQVRPGDTLGMLLEQYADWIRAGGEPAAANFFRALHLARHELRHSDFLAWLADPHGSHGLGEAFARWLIGTIAVLRPDALPARAGELDWSDLEVRREFANIDVLLLSEHHRVVVVIENKVRAREREGQLGDYRAFVRRHFAHEHLILVFLDMQGRASAEGSAVNLGYRDLLPFFERQLTGGTPSPNGDHARHLIEEYRRFLETKLWIRKTATTWQAPPRITDAVELIVRKNPSEVGTILNGVKNWKERIGEELGGWLLQVAKQTFRSKVAVRHRRVWFSFIPEEFDAVKSLRTLGRPESDFDGRMLFYQFFVVPFGDNVSVRPPQLALDVKLIQVRPEGERLKHHLHAAAKEEPLFNRVRGEKPAGFDHLLNHELLRENEIARYDLDELKMILGRRLDRFRRSIHPEIVAFMGREIAKFETQPMTI